MNHAHQDLSNRDIQRILFILAELAKFQYLLLDEFHFLCANNIPSINNFYKYLNLMRDYGYISIYKVTHQKVIKISGLEEKEKKNTIYTLSDAGIAFLESFGIEFLEVEYPKNTINKVRIEKFVEFKFNQFIHHHILVSQCLSFVLKKLLNSGHQNIYFVTDYLLKRVLGGTSQKIPDFIIYSTNSNGEQIQIWGECERSRKKNKDLKSQINGLSLAHYHGYEVYIFYPINAMQPNGFIAHRKIIESAIRRYSISPITVWFFEFELLDKAISKNCYLGCKNLISSGKKTFVPNLFSILSDSQFNETTGWVDNKDFEGNKRILYLWTDDIPYFISKKGNSFEVMPVIKKEEFDGYGNSIGFYMELNEKEKTTLNSRELAIQKSAEYIIKDLGLDNFLKRMQIYTPKGFKAFQNLQNAKKFFLEKDSSYCSFTLDDEPCVDIDLICDFERYRGKEDINFEREAL